MAWNITIINDWWILNYVTGSGRGLFECYIHAFSWRDCDESQVVVRPSFEPEICSIQFRNSTACARVLSVMSSCTGGRLTACN
jgi:hypothetical protein